MHAIGSRIERRRDQLRLSRRQLARMLDVESLCLYRWERTEVRPSLESAEKLARYLKVSLDWLVNGRESGYPRQRPFV
jgi:ribosome-binding protein aMBF1 (putative translation factor)